LLADDDVYLWVDAKVDLLAVLALAAASEACMLTIVQVAC
jgi:hypothetical protein